jgi:hypothetical protein
MHGLQAQAALLENLGARIDLHLLPEKFVRSAMEDVRQEALTLLANLKASLTSQYQGSVSLANDLGGETRKAIPGTAQGTEPAPAHHASPILSDLQALKNAENSLRSCLQ